MLTEAMNMSASIIEDDLGSGLTMLMRRLNTLTFVLVARWAFGERTTLPVTRRFRRLSCRQLETRREIRSGSATAASI